MGERMKSRRDMHTMGCHSAVQRWGAATGDDRAGPREGHAHDVSQVEQDRNHMAPLMWAIKQKAADELFFNMTFDLRNSIFQEAHVRDMSCFFSYTFKSNLY